MTADMHPDPFQDAVGTGLQRAMQIASCAVTATQVYAYQHRSQAMAAAERNDRARHALNAQIRAERDVARAGWAPALDQDWLPQADFYQVARAWSQAMPHADRNVPWYQPSAATAMRRCEERLRDLHPTPWPVTTGCAPTDSGQPKPCAKPRPCSPVRPTPATPTTRRAQHWNPGQAKT